MRRNGYQRAESKLSEIREELELGATPGQISDWFKLPITVVVELVKAVNNLEREPTCRPPRGEQKLPHEWLVYPPGSLTPGMTCRHTDEHFEPGEAVYCELCSRCSCDGHWRLRRTESQAAAVKRSQEFEAARLRRLLIPPSRRPKRLDVAGMLGKVARAE
jgi:hypothetical protein